MRPASLRQERPCRNTVGLESRVDPVAGRPELVEENGVTTVAFGPGIRVITEDRMDAVSEVVLQAAEADPPLVLIDLESVEFFGSSFISLLSQLWNQLRERPGGRLAICNANTYCAEILDVTHLGQLWMICPDRAAALKALRDDSA